MKTETKNIIHDLSHRQQNKTRGQLVPTEYGTYKLRHSISKKPTNNQKQRKKERKREIRGFTTKSCKQKEIIGKVARPRT